MTEKNKKDLARDPRPVTRSAFLCSVMALAAMVPFMVGCSDARGVGSGEGERTDAVLVLGCGACANRVAFDQLPEVAFDVLRDVAVTGGSLGLVSVEGEPRFFGAVELGSHARTDARRERENEASLKAVAEQITSGSYAATTAEADPFGAVGLAAKSISSIADEGTQKHIVVIDSLVGTAGAMNFANGMTLMSDPGEVLDYLRAQQACFDLSGIDVTLVYVGEVASPQEELSSKDRANLEEIWRIVLKEGCGASSVTFSPDVPVINSVNAEGLPEVTPVEVEKAAPFEGAAIAAGQIISLDGATRVSFMPDSAEFLDDEASRASISDLARTLSRFGAVVAIEGNTASLVSGQSERDAVALSLERASRVADLLVAEGFDKRRIRSVAGNGPRGGVFSEHIDDVDQSGALIPAAAQRNRCCVVAILETGVA